MYIYVGGACGETLVARDHIGTEILTMVSQAMKKSILGIVPIRKVCHVKCCLGVTMAS